MVGIRISNQIEICLNETPDALIRCIKNDLTLCNPTFDQAVKQGRSTYKIPRHIELYRCTDGLLVLPRGYGKTLVRRLREHQAAVEWDDCRLTLPPVSFQSMIRPRPYQERAIQELIRQRQGGVVATCGAGKTMILLEAMARIGQPTLWVTHTMELAEQVITRATGVLDLNHEEIGRIFGGQMTIGKRFTVALVQSLNKVDLSTLKDKFGAILIDEAHHMAATTFFHPVGQFPAMYRLWASATPERSDGLTEMVFAGAGPIVDEIDRSMVPTITPQLEVIETEFKSREDEYVNLMTSLIADAGRNELIVRTISREATGHYSLVLSDRVEHLQRLREMLASANPEASIETLVGSMSKKARAEVMERVQRREVDILLATQLAREGLDIKHLDRLFLVTPKRAAGAVQQEIGRVMRPEAGKKDAIVFDFWDNECPILRGQFWARREVYWKLGMDVPIGRRKAAM